MTLRIEQIESLFEFTRNAGVQYYDVQAELVDHLASEIEAALEADPALSFQQALGNAFSSFGPEGFRCIKNHKTEAVYIRYEKLWSEEARRWLTPKYLLLLVAIGLAAYFLGTFVDPFWRFYVVVAVFIVLLYFQLTKAREQKKEATKKLLVLEFLESKKWSALAMDAIIINIATGDWFAVPVGIVVVGVLFFFVSRIAVHNVHQRMILQAQNEYPEAFA